MLSQNEERKLIPPNRYGTDPIVKTATWYILYKSSIDLQNQGRMSVYGMERRKSPLPVAGVMPSLFLLFDAFLLLQGRSSKRMTQATRENL
eukprot:5992181-Ditylum_brightwellii.AAC.1